MGRWEGPEQDWWCQEAGQGSGPGRPATGFTTDRPLARTQLRLTDGGAGVSREDGGDVPRMSPWVRAERGLGPQLDPFRSGLHIPSWEPWSGPR